MKSRALLIALVAFIGMVDALYLSIQRNAGPIPCHVTRGCTDVVTSRYSAVFGVPISWFGFVFYLGVFSLAVFSRFETEQTGQWLKWVFWLSGIALVVSAMLTGIQAFILKAFCEYCLLSATLVLTIFLLSLGPAWRKRPQ
jgi:uncharacterized membrane protein